MLDYGIDAAAAGTLVQFSAQIRDGIRIPGRDHLYLTGIRVAHGAAQTQRSGFPVNKPAKTNTLHASANKKMRNHEASSVSE